MVDAIHPGAALALQDVSHAFTLRGDTLPVLENIELSAAPGEFVSLLGPSGSGKSTLLRLVAGLDLPQQGSVQVDGAIVTGPDPSRIVVFQDPTLYPWRTVRNNVALGPQAQRLNGSQDVRIEAALALVGLSEFAHVYPHQLSGGMAQRAALARALVNDPRLLLLDEPLGKLDSLTRMKMQGELVRLWQRARFTVLMVTHDIDEALLLSGRVIVLSDRPARIVGEVKVESPYPRRRDDPYLAGLRHEIFGLLGLTEEV